jgi:hypothetical protein
MSNSQSAGTCKRWSHAALSSTFGVDDVNRHRVPENSPVVGGPHDINKDDSLFRAGISPINAIFIGLQGQPVRSWDPSRPIVKTD